MNPIITRAQLLMQHRRFEDAERELRGLLANEPDSFAGHALLALCLNQRDAWQDATAEAETAVHLAPDVAFAHYALAAVMCSRNRYQDALRAVEEAIRLDPYDESQFALMSRVLFAQSRWDLALQAAEQGLEVNPEDVDCNNLRTLALEKLGRLSFARNNATETLRRAPDDPTAHAVQGWTVLAQGDHRQALEHFREALRLDPNNEFARQGMIDALNSHNPVFRLVHRFYLWMARMGSGAQWAIILGGIFGQRLLRQLAREKPELGPYIWPILLAYFGFVMLTWIANPLFNTFLRFNRFGRYLLNRDQLWASNLLAGIIIGSVLWAGGMSLLLRFDLAFLGGVYGLLLLIPMSAIFNCDWGWPRFVMIAIAGGVALLGGSAVLLLTLGFAAGIELFGGYGIGVFVSQFAANALARATPQK